MRQHVRQGCKHCSGVRCSPCRLSGSLPSRFDTSARWSAGGPREHIEGCGIDRWIPSFVLNESTIVSRSCDAILSKRAPEICRDQVSTRQAAGVSNPKRQRRFERTTSSPSTLATVFRIFRADDLPASRAHRCTDCASLDMTQGAFALLSNNV